MLKIGDYGMLKNFENNEGRLYTKLGTQEFMAPELFNKEGSYQGPPVDIFAMGVNLMLIHTTVMPFANATSDWFYSKFQKDPVKHCKRLGMNVEDSFVELVAAMTRQDPAERLSIEQVRAHPWMQGAVAKVEEVAKHFYTIVPNKQLMDQAHYESQQKARMDWSTKNAIMRSSSEVFVGPDQDTVDEWEHSLTYKPFHDSVASYSAFTGFYSETVGGNLFLALWEYLAQNYPDTDPEVDTSNWKITFAISENRPYSKLSPDDSDEGEPLQNEVDISATVR